MFYDVILPKTNKKSNCTQSSTNSSSCVIDDRQCLSRSPECVFHFAGAVFVTDDPIQAGGTEAVLAAGALETLVAEAGPVDVVALGPVLAVAFVGALWPIGADWTLLLASDETTTEER